MITDISQNEIMTSFDNVIQYLKYFIEDDAAISIANTEAFLKFYDGQDVKLNKKDGDPLPVGSIAHMAVTKGEVISSLIPEEVFGVPTKAIGIPIKENGKVVGAISIAKSLKKQTTVSDLSKTLHNSLSQISSAINEFSTNIQNMAQFNSMIQENVEKTKKEAENTDGILQFVANIARQTNLLGLNAAIESSKAGELGKGFGVVAKEIRKLSNSSNESINQINNILKNIQSSVTDISDKINKSNEVFEQQTGTIEEITSSIESLYSTAEVLKEISSKL
ncbi:MAG: methyl-accepting chemotaxis protein [Clostridium sp.]|nr:methyl-accepting chemotaxis protein [Clostridium sp.]